MIRSLTLCYQLNTNICTCCYVNNVQLINFIVISGKIEMVFYYSMVNRDSDEKTCFRAAISELYLD